MLIQKHELRKQYMKTYADAHNHLNGILPSEAIKVMLSSAREEWDKGEFKKIPQELILNSKALSFTNTSVTNDYGWIDCLDVLARLIVFSCEDIKNKTNYYASKDYHEAVKMMLFIKDGDKTGSGRGMNSAGLLLSGCIALRCLLAFYKDGHEKNKVEDILETEIDKYFNYLINRNVRVSFEELLLTTCLIDVDKGISEDNWLFTKFNKFKVNIPGNLDNPLSTHLPMNPLSLDPLLQACAEQIAISSVTASLSTSMWIPFDDAYALRSLLTKGKVNKVNYIMLTLRWLLENEAIRGNYFAEISISTGDLREVCEIIKNNAVDFGFKQITTGGEITKSKLGAEGTENYMPLVIENNKDRRNLPHNSKLYLRFLTGSLNSNCVKSDIGDIEQVLIKELHKIDDDQKFGCFAGIDMFGIENFVYEREFFTKWLNGMYEKLREINKESGGKRNLWLRPHVGEGSWAEDSLSRTKKYDGNPLSLAKKLKTLSEFFGKDYISKTKNVSILNELLEFIYRSLFTGWFPIDDVRRFYNTSAFSIPELSRLSSSLQPVNPSNGVMGEKIGEANLETMIDWVNHISSTNIESYDRYHPQIRFGHGSHLGFDSVWSVVTDLQANSFTTVWVDLNLGSNVVTAAKPQTHIISNVNFDERLTNVSTIESALKEIITSARFTCGYIQTETVERSERIARFIELLSNYNIKFILGTDGQGSELTSLFSEQLHFKNLMYWYYKNSDKAELMNKRLKNNILDYIKYALGNLKEEG